MNKQLNKIVITAVFAALATVATMVMNFPIYATGGYINIGDTIVLLSAWIIGGVYGGLAAGIGSALADLLSGYLIFAPGTLIIKFAMAFVGYLIYKLSTKAVNNNYVAWIVSAIVAELIMIGGYFIYESVFLGYGLGATASIPGNGIQAGGSIVIGVIVIIALDKINIVKSVKKLI